VFGEDGRELLECHALLLELSERGGVLAGQDHSAFCQLGAAVLELAVPASELGVLVLQLDETPIELPNRVEVLAAKLLIDHAAQFAVGQWALLLATGATRLLFFALFGLFGLRHSGRVSVARKRGATRAFRRSVGSTSPRASSSTRDKRPATSVLLTSQSCGSVSLGVLARWDPLEDQLAFVHLHREGLAMTARGSRVPPRVPNNSPVQEPRRFT
jgi:hypothetical protein